MWIDFVRLDDLITPGVIDLRCFEKVVGVEGFIDHAGPGAIAE